ncbi:MAG: hypothetical protein QM755_23675 [Luteolibacter sp.]
MADKQFKIQIIVDGTERTISDMDKVVQKTTQEAAAINQATAALEKQAAAQEKVTEAKKKGGEVSPQINDYADQPRSNGDDFEGWRQEQNAARKERAGQGPTWDEVNARDAQRASEARKEQIRLAREAEQAEQDLVDAEHAAAEAARMAADVEEAKARVAKQSAEEQASSMEIVNRAAKSFVATTFLNHVNQAVEAMRGITKEGTPAAKALDAGSTAIGAFGTGLQTFIATGNPVLGIIGGITEGVRHLVKAYGEAKEALQEQIEKSKEWVKQTQFMIENRRQLLREIRDGNLANIFANERIEIELAVSALKTLQGINQARRQTANTGRESEISYAERRGQDTTTLRGADVIGDAKDELTAFVDQLKTLAGAFATAHSNLNAEETKLSNMRNDQRSTQDELDAQQRKVNEADAKVSLLNDQFTGLMGSVDSTKERISIEGKGRFDQLALELGEKNKGYAEQAEKIISEDLKESGKSLLATNKASLAALARTLSDNVADAAQGEQMGAFIGQIKTDKALSDAAYKELDTLQKQALATKPLYDTLISQQQQIIQVTSSTQEQVSALQKSTELLTRRSALLEGQNTMLQNAINALSNQNQIQKSAQRTW